MGCTVAVFSRASRRRREGRDVFNGLARELGLAVGHRLDRHADIRDVGEREAEEDVHIEVGLARFPGEGALNQVHQR
jgi:hypothetical protein